MVKRTTTMAEVAALDPNVDDDTPAQDLFVIQLRCYPPPSYLHLVAANLPWALFQPSPGTATGTWRRSR